MLEKIYGIGKKTLEKIDTAGFNIVKKDSLANSPWIVAIITGVVTAMIVTSFFYFIDPFAGFRSAKLDVFVEAPEQISIEPIQKSFSGKEYEQLMKNRNAPMRVIIDNRGDILARGVSLYVSFVGGIGGIIPADPEVICWLPKSNFYGEIESHCELNYARRHDLGKNQGQMVFDFNLYVDRNLHKKDGIINVYVMCKNCNNETPLNPVDFFQYKINDDGNAFVKNFELVNN